MKLLIAIVALSMLSGCVAVVAGSAAVSAVTVGEDPRTLGTQIDDTTRASNIRGALGKVPAIDKNANIDVHVFNGIALLYGQALNSSLKAKAEQVVKNASNVTVVHNQIRIANNTASTTRAHDIWLSTKVRSSLLTNESVNSLLIDVIVEDSEVFLMGIVTPDQATKAVEVSRNIGGVVKVYNVFEIKK